MNEPFNLPVNYQGTAYEFKARFERWGYSHRIAVLIGETTVTFEPDEEGSYRALSDSNAAFHVDKPGLQLLQAVAEKLASLSSR